MHFGIIHMICQPVSELGHSCPVPAVETAHVSDLKRIQQFLALAASIMGACPV